MKTIGYLSLVFFVHAAQALDLVDRDSGAGPAVPVLSNKSKELRTDVATVEQFAKVQEELNSLNENGNLPHHEIKLDATLESLSDYERFLRRNRNDHQKYIRHCLEMLRRFPPSSKMAFYLWSCASKEDSLGRTDDEAASSNDLPVLLDLCEKLPKDNRWYQEARFIRMEWWARQNKMNQARAVLDDLLKLELGDDVRFGVFQRKGSLLEREGEYEGALEAYSESLDGLGQFEASNECQLRSVFIHLGLGNEDEALGLIARFRDARASIRGPNATQIYRLLELTEDPEKARSYWKATASWWKAFEAIEKTLGEKEQAKILVPVFSELLALDDLNDLAKATDKAGFYAGWRKRVFGARWMPEFMTDACNIATFSGVALFPAHAVELRNLAISMGESLPESEPGVMQQNLFLLTVNYLELNQAEKAIGSIHRYMEFPEKNPVVERAMVRLWGMASTNSGKDSEAAIEAITKLLNDPDANATRALTVNTLAELYRRMGDLKAEEKLLARELQHPRIQNDERMRDVLKMRYDALAHAGEASKKFAEAVNDFIEKQDLPWWDDAEPASLQDPRLKNLGSVMSNPDQLFVPAQRLKLYLLVAAEEKQPFERRLEAWANAVRHRLYYMTTHDQLHEVYKQIIEDERFPAPVRRDWHWRGLLDAMDERNPERIGWYMNHDLMSRFNDNQRKYVDTLKPFAELDLADMDAVEKLAENLQGEELDSSQIGLYLAIFAHFLQQGELERADAIYQAAKNLRFAPDVRTTVKAVRLSMIKQLNQAKEYAPLHQRMMELVWERFSEADVEEPERYKTFRYPHSIYNLPVDERNQSMLWKIKQQEFEKDSLNFWQSFIRYLAREDRSPKTIKLVFSVLEESLRLAPDDLSRAQVIGMAAGTIDMDDPGERKQLYELMKPYRDSETYPTTAAEIQFREIEMELRLGKKLNLEQELSNLTDELGNQTPETIRMQYYLQTKNKERLRQALDALSADEQLSSRWLSESLRAYRILNMKEEAQLAEESAADELKKAITASWADPEGSGYFIVFDLADIIGGESIPEAWFKATIAKMPYKKNQHYVQMRYAYAKKNWKDCEKAAGNLVKTYPNFYDYYWYQGFALQKLGKNKEAIKALKVYTKYSKSDIQYPEAMALLKKAEEAVLLDQAL